MADEQDWIEAARQGDVEAWEQLVGAHQQSIFRLAYLFLGDADDAEDIAQETFIRAYRALNRFDSSRPIRPWLMRIGVNLCHNWSRKLKRYMNALQNALRAEPLLGSTLDQVENRSDMEDLWKAINRLPPADQKMIYLRYFLDYSEAETAEVLGIPTGTVKSRSHRALDRVRTVLHKDYPQWIREGSNGK